MPQISLANLFRVRSRPAGYYSQAAKAARSQAYLQIRRMAAQKRVQRELRRGHREMRQVATRRKSLVKVAAQVAKCQAFIAKHVR